MTIATDLGFKIGELYRVVDEGKYYAVDMIVRFDEDDNSYFPWFTYVSGPKGDCTDKVDGIAINLEDIVPVEQPTTPSNKPLLLLYIHQQYPDDKVLKALVESI